MTMRFDFSDFSRRFSLNDILRQLPLKSVEQAELDAQKAAYFAQGGTITKCPPPTYTPKPVIARKPHPEARVKPVKRVCKIPLAYSMQAPAGMLSIGAAAPLCGLKSNSNRHLNKIREAVDSGLLVADHRKPYADKELYYFLPETITEFYARVGEGWWKHKQKIPTTKMSVALIEKIIELRASGKSLEEVSVLAGLSPTAVKRGVKLYQEFGAAACKGSVV